MDLSSLPEDQKQQLQQLQHQFQQHQQQQQQEAAQQQQQQQQRQQQQQEHYYYDQSSYDQHQSYYSHYQQQNPQPYRQHYDYYTNAYRQPSEAEPLPAVESGGTAGLGQGQQDQVYYPQHVGSGGDQSNLGFPAAAAAASALSQLTQYGHIVGHGAPGSFVGPGPALYGGQPVGRLANRFGGRRGGCGGHGNFGNRGRGRGRGRGMPSLYSPQGASSSFAHPEEVAQPLAENSDKPAQAEMPKGDAGPTQQHVRVAWCELCRVDCTSMEILEQHKNGKKHRKNMQKLEASKIVHQIPVINIQSASDSNPDGKLQPENVNEGEDNNNGTEQNHDLVGQVQNPEEEQSYNQRRGMKRKMRGNRGGKRMKTSDAPRQAIKPPKQPKVVIPLICDLCNVKCDTQEVFDRHLSGKKHISKHKRFESHQALYGPTGLQALYPPNPISQTLYQSQGPQQTFSRPLGLHPTPTAHIGPQVHAAAAAAGVVDSGFQQNPEQVLDGRLEPGTQQASAAVSLS